MNLYLLECGNQHIIFIKEFNCYHFISKELMQIFKIPPAKLDQLNHGHYFPSDDVALIDDFINPEKNRGAMIAHNDTQIGKISVYQRRHYKNLINQFKD